MKKNYKILFAVMLVFTLLGAAVTPARAQNTDYGIRLVRNFGYGGGLISGGPLRSVSRVMRPRWRKSAF